MPIPSNISAWWNFGYCRLIQIVTGIFYSQCFGLVLFNNKKIQQNPINQLLWTLLIITIFGLVLSKIFVMPIKASIGFKKKASNKFFYSVALEIQVFNFKTFCREKKKKRLRTHPWKWVLFHHLRSKKVKQIGRVTVIFSENVFILIVLKDIRFDLPILLSSFSLFYFFFLFFTKLY